MRHQVSELVAIREALLSAATQVLHPRRLRPAPSPLPVDQSMWCSCMLCGQRFESHWIGRRICPTCKAQES
jgi:hypothetical protein